MKSLKKAICAALIAFSAVSPAQAEDLTDPMLDDMSVVEWARRYDKSELEGMLSYVRSEMMQVNLFDQMAAGRMWGVTKELTRERAESLFADAPSLPRHITSVYVPMDEHNEIKSFIKGIADKSIYEQYPENSCRKNAIFKLTKKYKLSTAKAMVSIIYDYCDLPSEKKSSVEYAQFIGCTTAQCKSYYHEKIWGVWVDY